MSERETIKFEILSTDYDIKKVEDAFNLYCEKDLYYTSSLANKYPQLIKNYKEVKKEKRPLSANILIIEDDVVCIVKYLYLIELYIQNYTYPKINNVIACTKAESVNYVLDNLGHPMNKNSKPNLVILDFDLQEKKDSLESIIQIVERIETVNWYSEFLPVSGFKSVKEKGYKSFEARLRERHHQTFEKERLDDHELMLNILEYLLNRKIPEIYDSVKFDEPTISGNEAYMKLERHVGKDLVVSTIEFLDNLEEGIRHSCEKQEKLNADIHKIKNMRNNFYTSSTLAQQIPKRHKIINELLVLSYQTPFLLNRWKFFEHQVCHYKFSKKYLRCPCAK